MTFTPAPYEKDNPVNVQRWEDASGRWSINVERVFAGYRVQLHNMEATFSYPDVVLDYCAGPSTEWVEALVTVLREGLRLIPDTWYQDQVYRAFPRWHQRPMHRDPECWATLCRLAHIDPAQPVEDIGDVTFDRTRASLVQMYLTHVHTGINRDYAKETLDTLSSFIPTQP